MFENVYIWSREKESSLTIITRIITRYKNQNIELSMERKGRRVNRNGITVLKNTYVHTYVYNLISNYVSRDGGGGGGKNSKRLVVGSSRVTSELKA